MFVQAIAALGNPPDGYAQTRHNAGFEWIDRWADSHGFRWKRHWRAGCMVASGEWNGSPLRLLKPRSFMNLSGIPLGKAIRFFRFDPSRVVVAYDDIALPTGGLKISQRGSAGGHNGIKSLLEHVGDHFIRLRLGIGNQRKPGQDLADYVLERFPPEEWEAFQQALPLYDQAVQTILDHGPEQAMNQFNRKISN